MNTEPNHNIFGISVSEWIKRVPNELPSDAVGLWQIIPVGTDSFGLVGADLECFAKRCIVALIKAGAKPVVPSSCENNYWEYQPQYGCDPEIVAEAIVQAWRQSPILASHDGLWFDLLGGEFCRGT